MNRHHYALYVHNCRLVFLLRKDFDQADTFRPAEFHWKLDQVHNFLLLLLNSSVPLSHCSELHNDILIQRPKGDIKVQTILVKTSAS